MIKLLIDKQVILDRIAELEALRNNTYNAHKLTSIESKISELNSILQQSEEYDENEAIEFADWCSSQDTYNKTVKQCYDIWKNIL